MEQALANIAASEILDGGLAIGLIFTVLFFIDRRLWPWFTQEYWPTIKKQREESVQAMTMVGKSLQALESLMEMETRTQANISDKVTRIEQKVDALLASMTASLSLVSNLPQIISLLQRKEPTPNDTTPSEPNPS